MVDDIPGGGETGAALRATDWSKTPLGAISGWSMSLKALVRTMLHARQPMILWWGPELIQLYNDAMLDSMRDKHPRGMGQPGREAWKQAWLAVGHELQAVVDSGTAIWAEDVFVPVDRNGGIEDAWWTYNYSPVFDDDGSRAGMLIVCTETTKGVVAMRALERARREADLAREEQESAFEQSPTPIAILTGTSLVFTFANSAYERLVARPVLGKAVEEAFDPSELLGFHALLAQVMETGAPIDLRAAELRLKDAEGVVIERHVDVSFHPFRNAEGHTGGIVVMVSDVTLAVNASREEARLQQERADMLAREQALRAQAEQANRLKDEFLATVSHELRTPLNAILGWAQLMASGNLAPDRSKRALATIERNARAQSQLINDLLDVARITAGQLKLDVEPVELAAPVEAALDGVRPAADARGLTLKTALDPRLTVRGDASRIQQIAWNILTNAVKFSQRGGSVLVTLERRESFAVLTVTDDGRGIDARFLPFVFDRFRQAQGSSTREHGGLGLGLAIVKQLVELHGGTVSVDSAGLGHGSTFEVRIPTATRRPPGSRPSSPSGPGSAPVMPCPPELAGLKILVVDDEADTRDLLVTILEQCGVEVAAAASVAAARTKLSSFRPDVLLSDIGMPHEDGYALIRELRLRSPAEGGRIAAIALTAFARAEDRAAALDAGFEAFLPKPVEPAELLAVLAALATERS